MQTRRQQSWTGKEWSPLLEVSLEAMPEECVKEMTAGLVE